MTIYVIAGPPGIGKSTNARELIPADIPIIDQDLAGYQYKRQGFVNYQDLVSRSTNQQIRTLLMADEDFALELNLGFQSHYDYFKSIAYFNPANHINLLLFFTDDLTLCIDRAKVRYQNGGHLVSQEIVEEMYRNTLPLFVENKTIFDSVRLIDMGDSTITEYYTTDVNLPAWIVENDLKRYLNPA